MTILEACPFCGHSATLQYDDERRWRQVVCGGCGAKSSEHPSEDAPAIAAWNRRATRSVPEAGKAVDAVTIPEKLANNLYRFLLQLSTAAVTLRGLHGDITGNAHLYAEALKAAFDASVPAPSGAEKGRGE